MLTATTSRKVRGALANSLTVEESKLYERIPEHMEYVSHPSFELSKTEEELFGSDVQVDVPRWTDFPEVSDEPRALQKHRTSVTPKEEVLLFLRYNYACFRLAKLIEAQRRRRAVGRARQMLLWFERVQQGRSDLVHANMALVLAMGRRTRIPNVEFSEMISEGNMALLRSVEKFDVARGFKFSTYACRSILKSFNRLASKTGRYRMHCPTEFDPDLENGDQEDTKHDRQHEDAVDSLKEVLDGNRAELSDVEQIIVRERFGLNERGKKRTLSEVGGMVGLTNERIRQIQNGALVKLREVLNDRYLAA